MNAKIKQRGLKQWAAVSALCDGILIRLARLTAKAFAGGDQQGFLESSKFKNQMVVVQRVDDND